MSGDLRGRVRRLEARQDTGAPDACAVRYPPEAGGRVEVYINGTGERMPLAEYEARWPHHRPLKYYGDPRMAQHPLEADWSDAPPPNNR